MIFPWLSFTDFSQDYQFLHLSAGELLRQERQTAGSQYGDLIAGHIKNGTIVPVAITCSLLKRVGIACRYFSLKKSRQEYVLFADISLLRRVGRLLFANISLFVYLVISTNELFRVYGSSSINLNNFTRCFVS